MKSKRKLIVNHDNMFGSSRIHKINRDQAQSPIKSFRVGRSGSPQSKFRKHVNYSPLKMNDNPTGQLIKINSFYKK